MGKLSRGLAALLLGGMATLADAATWGLAELDVQGVLHGATAVCWDGEAPGCSTGPFNDEASRTSHADRIADTAFEEEVHPCRSFA